MQVPPAGRNLFGHLIQHGNCRLKVRLGKPVYVIQLVNSPTMLKISGEVAQRVMMVLDRQINPSIAAHGGHAELVAIEDNTAYLRLSGGCQGCSMATVTLGQGIEVAIKELVPEITRVLDVTDHASGTSPYFEAAKK